MSDEANHRNQLIESYHNWLAESQDMELPPRLLSLSTTGHLPPFGLMESEDSECCGQSVHTESVSEEESETSEEGRLFIVNDDEEEKSYYSLGRQHNLLMMIKIQELVAKNPYALTCEEMDTVLLRLYCLLRDHVEINV